MVVVSIDSYTLIFGVEVVVVLQFVLACQFGW